MLILLKSKATKEQIFEASKDFDGFIKVVIDLENMTATIGGERHYDGEQLLLENGSKQENLWGGGLDLESKEIDYNSMINLRPKDNNPSRDILAPKIRSKFDQIIKTLLLDD